MRFFSSLRACTSLALILLLSDPAVAADPAAPAYVRPDDVKVTRQGEGFHLEIDMLAPVKADLAWQVLTDFANMSRFVPNLEMSKATPLGPTQVRVEQQGTAHWGIFSLKFESVREIELRPMSEIIARQVSGTSRQMNSRMQLQLQPDGQTKLIYRADIVPEGGLPPLIGPMAVRHETAEQFSAVIGEMVRRAGKQVVSQ